MNAHPADPKSLGDGSWALPSGPHFTDPLDRDGRLVPLVDALGLCSLDARLLLLADELALHLGHHVQHGHTPGGAVQKLRDFWTGVERRR